VAVEESGLGAPTEEHRPPQKSAGQEPHGRRSDRRGGRGRGRRPPWRGAGAVAGGRHRQQRHLGRERRG
jgi:hypothetical protein